MIDVYPLGLKCVLPAFVVGFEVSSGRFDDPCLPKCGSIVGISQQFAGYSVNLHSGILGCVLRLEGNRQYERKQPLLELVRGLKAMAEDPHDVVLQQFPVLRNLVRTHGQPYSNAEIHVLSNFVRPFVDIPPVQDGYEALIRFNTCDPLEFFENWKVLSFKKKSTSDKEITLLCEDTLSQFEIEQSVAFDDRLLLSLSEVARSICLRDPLRIFLLWENCD